MGFTVGYMIWMVIAEVVPAAFKEASTFQVVSIATLSIAFTEIISIVLKDFE